MTLDQLRRQLSAIEPDDTTFAGIKPSDIPLLEQLLQDNEPWMAARVIFALSRLDDDRAVAAIRKVVADPRPEVRVAVAASAANLHSVQSDRILSALLNDPDVGVRKFAIQSISEKNKAGIRSKLQAIETQDPVSQIREHARQKRRELTKRTGTPPSLRRRP
jgi:HEAT repeat protein